MRKPFFIAAGPPRRQGGLAAETLAPRWAEAGKQSAENQRVEAFGELSAPGKQE